MDVLPLQQERENAYAWSKLPKILIAVLTAMAGSIGVVSCTLMR